MADPPLVCLEVDLDILVADHRSQSPLHVRFNNCSGFFYYCAKYVE
jgi:hypothetical protein